jgi:UDP-N-acetylglucosamine diphosphorylase/glucosamine-1-phosphate N-acetyltransferase
MNLILFDPPELFTRFFPLTMSRPISKIRVGILTIAEKWEHISGKKVSFLSAQYLQKKFPAMIEGDNLLVNGSIIPDHHLFDRIASLKMEETLWSNDIPLAFRTSDRNFDEFFQNWNPAEYRKIVYEAFPEKIQRLADIFLINGDQIIQDISLINGIKQYPVRDVHSVIYSGENVYIGEGTSIKAGILDADTGPIYIGDEVTIQPGAVICGPCAILQGSVVILGAKIRPNTTLGPFCKVGGEVSNVVFQGYTNKSHDGFLGSSVIGEWCNFGAGTNNSNLKNNYSDIKVWDYAEEKMTSSGLQYFGLIMGDHTKCGINTMFNTGTVAGFSANIYDGGYMPKFIPSFAWGNRNGFTAYELEKAVYTARMVMERRSVTMSHEDSEIFEYIFNLTSKHRLP